MTERLARIPAAVFPAAVAVAKKYGVRAGLTLAAMLLIAAAVVVCYENSLDGEFVFDDSYFIVKNDNIKNLTFEDTAGFAKSVEHIVGFNPFRSLLSFSFALHYMNIPREDKDQRGFVPDTRPFHIANIAIHLINGLLVFFLVRVLLQWGRDRRRWAVPYFSALAAALLFSTAAVGTEAVTYIVGRSNSMCTMFCLASALAFLGARKVQENRYEGENAKGRGRWTVTWMLLILPAAVFIYKLLVVSGARPRLAALAAGGLVFLLIAGVSLLFIFFSRRLQLAGDSLMLLSYFLFGLAALTKELAIVLPFLLLLLEVLVLSGGKRGYMRRRWKYHVLTFGTIILLLALRFTVIEAASGKQATALWEGTQVDFNYTATQISGPVMTGYLKQFFCPVHLNIDNDVPIFTAQQAGQPLTINFAVLFIIILFTIWLAGYARMFAAGVLWYFIALIPTSTFLKFGDAMDEGRIYLPIVGLCWAAAAAAMACFNALKTRPLRIIAGAAGLALLAGIVAMNCYHTRKRNLDYKTAIRLWHDTALKSPLKARVHNGLGYELMTFGQRLLEMENHAERAVNLRKELKQLRGESEPDRELIKTYQEMFDERVAELSRLIEDQRKCLAAAGTMFQTSIALYEGETWSDLTNAIDKPDRLNRIKIIFDNLQSYGVHENLAVAYSSRATALRCSEKLSEEMGIDRAETLHLMRSSIYAASKSYELTVRFYPASNVMTNYGLLCKSMANYWYQKGDYHAYERYSRQAEMLVTFVLIRINPNFHPARALIREIARNLARYYDPLEEKYPGRKDARKARHYYQIWEKWPMSKDERDLASEKIRLLTEHYPFP